MLIAQHQEAELCVNAEVDTLEILSQSVDSNLVPPTLAVPMLTVLVLEGLLSVRVDLAILVTHTQIVSLIPAPATLAVNKLFVRIMVGLLSANVLQALLEIHMSLADKILVQLEMPVVLTLIVPIVVDVHSVNADVAM